MGSHIVLKSFAPDHGSLISDVIPSSTPDQQCDYIGPFCEELAFRIQILSISAAEFLLAALERIMRKNFWSNEHNTTVTLGSDRMTQFPGAVSYT